ncbi:MAG: hypothetical protein H7Z13_11005 [Ferruginibacter sp.]|nr:hypothetical protein [Ferruginibacter sp.]
MKFLKDIFDWNIQGFQECPYRHSIPGVERISGINGAVIKKAARDQPLMNSISIINLAESIQLIEPADEELETTAMVILSCSRPGLFLEPDENCPGILKEDSMQNNDFI